MKIKDLTLPTLPYNFSDLEPFISAKIMELHLTKHQNTYLTKLKAGVESMPDLQDTDLEEALQKISSLPQNLQATVRNMGGGFWNHSFFWKILTKPNTSEISNTLKIEIEKNLQSVEAFTEKFTTMSTSLFGSGWVWLIKNKTGGLEVVQTPNQDNPLMDISLVKGTPILGIDLWEHAYYLDYLSDRAQYVNNFFKIINWTQVEKNLSNAS